MGVHDEVGRFQVGPRLGAEPAHDGHPTIVALVIDEDLAPQIMVEVDLVPGPAKVGDAFVGRPRQTAPGCSARKISPRTGSSSRNKIRDFGSPAWST